MCGRNSRSDRLAIGDDLPATAKRLQIALDGNAVELDGTLDRFGRDRHGSRLECRTHQEHVGVLLVPEEFEREFTGVEVDAPLHRPVDGRRDLCIAGVGH